MKRISILFYLLLLNTISYSQEGTQQTKIQDYLIKEDNNDFKFLDKTINDVQVLAIGESTHGTKEFNLIYLKMFKYLVEEHNFTTLFLEDEYSRCLALDEYVKCEEDCKSVSAEVLRNWPWVTHEMNKLIEWIKNHNRSISKHKISIVGIDVQDSKHICLTLNQILRSSNQDTIALIRLSPNKAETERKHIKQVKKFANPELIDSYRAKSNSIEKAAQKIYAKLLDNLEWNRLMNKKPKWRIRDLAMGKNMLAYLSKFPKNKGMLIAHNAHIANLNESKKNELKSIVSAGGVVNRVLGEKYFAIMQEFDEGCFNAYSLLPKKNIPVSNNKKNYELTKVCIEESIENSIGSILRTGNAEIVYMTESDLFNSTPLDELRYHDIGGLFIAQKKNTNQTKQFFYLKQENWFDAIIFHKHSTPTSLIDD